MSIDTFIIKESPQFNIRIYFVLYSSVGFDKWKSHVLTIYIYVFKNTQIFIESVL